MVDDSASDQASLHVLRTVVATATLVSTSAVVTTTLAFSMILSPLFLLSFTLVMLAFVTRHLLILIFIVKEMIPVFDCLQMATSMALVNGGLRDVREVDLLNRGLEELFLTLLRLIRLGF